MLPTVSIIVNCYNQAHCLERSVRSVLAQTWKNWECLIVDDGSTDDTKHVAQMLAATDERIRYCPKPNGGLPAARNYGVQHAQGEWIQCLDGDDWIAPEKIEFQLDQWSQLQQSSDKVVLYGDYQRVYLTAEGRIANREDHVIGDLTPDQFLQRMLTPDFLTQTPHPALQQAMLMHRSVIEQHRFPEHLKALGDRFFAVDLLAQGVNFIYTPVVGAFYTKHLNNRTNNWPYMRDYYICFYETVYAQYPDCLELCHDGISFLIDEAIREHRPEEVCRLQTIAAFPLHVLNGTRQINSPQQLRLFHWLSRLLPKFVLYPQCRGPRSQKLWALFDRHTHSPA